ncbi:MAG TPA: ribose 5-phosphate isomerase B [Candidatus Parabacteroides intestinigallinarum]|uniref:Ribose 5-phosphate isomerase B n=1 Tax=Candidatus Parabacteroides intestinigallinarum TaxID=2838722 RepID=A0A9D1XSH6_9BACT|nr:ribose 5-phosphate isomerase B [Candidatus Parabacteroides intestinigallinarum]
MIGLCSDHAGYELKEYIKTLLDARGLSYKDFGTYSSDSCDYPDYAHPMAEAIERGEVYPGIAICGTGNGIGMTLNKHQGVRAALCWRSDIAQLARAHNDANVVVVPGRFISLEDTRKIIEVFLDTPFEGGRHARRIQKIPVR